ncbi:MAG: hypothetical protein R3310_09720 [Candidatus Competibacteraceae bacterium]|nr:hypothetical protein [Candidatus Competibacteraceae bacterium]
MSDKDKIEGEGSRTAARQYNKDTREFVESGRVEQKAREAAQASPAEEAEMKKAEEEGKSHAKEEDPALHRNYNKPD